MHHGIVENCFRGIKLLEVVDKEVKLVIDGIERSMKVTHSSFTLFISQVFFASSLS
jgi:hypothetical protein